mmetsp:Transcript_3329/g.8555  ORF Transcript_3329/g.8555 Transcript_3329/m.8555 type:complete len:303 (+) Transcript_3329:228-1136(+)
MPATEGWPPRQRRQDRAASRRPPRPGAAESACATCSPSPLASSPTARPSPAGPRAGWSGCRTSTTLVPCATGSSPPPRASEWRSPFPSSGWTRTILSRSTTAWPSRGATSSTRRTPCSAPSSWAPSTSWSPWCPRRASCWCTLGRRHPAPDTPASRPCGTPAMGPAPALIRTSAVLTRSAPTAFARTMFAVTAWRATSAVPVTTPASRTRSAWIPTRPLLATPSACVIQCARASATGRTSATSGRSLPATARWAAPSPAQIPSTPSAMSCGTALLRRAAPPRSAPPRCHHSVRHRRTATALR